MRITEKVFWGDPYMTRLETRITSIDGNDVTVAETIFYALSGGQESDSGTIDGRRVTEARKQGKDIVYTLEHANGLAPQAPVVMEIDWERRYRLMRLHFAAEIVLELVTRKLDSIEKIGAHIASDKARIDFIWRQNLSPVLPTLNDELQRLVHEDRPIASAYSDEEAEYRYWEIEGFARVPCGGTHLRRTGEIGDTRLKRRNIGKDKERIEVYLRALD